VRQARISIVDIRRPEVEESDAALLALAKQRIEAVGRDGPDLVLLPETFANHPRERTRSHALEASQEVHGPIGEELAALARRYDTYIAFGLLRRSGAQWFNSLVLLDRRGKPVWMYDKVAPVDWELTDMRIIPGAVPKPFLCDFGRIGGAICFDIHFNELAELYFRQDVELLLFSSEFPAGRLLDSWALAYGFAIAASTSFPRNRIVDCTGATVGRTSDRFPYVTAVLNLNRRVVPLNYNLDKLDRMLTRYAGDVILEDLRDEGACVITGLKQGLEVTALIEEFGIIGRATYFDRSRRLREEHGGLPVPTWL